MAVITSQKLGAIEKGVKTAAESISIVGASDSTFATAGNQTTANGSLAAINGKLPTALGAQAIAGSISVTPATGSTFATAANQTTGNTSLATVATNTGTANTTLSSILAKIIASPATEALQTALNTVVGQINAKFSALGVQTAASSISVTEAQDSLHWLRTFAPRLTVSGVASTSGDNTASIPAPAAGTRVVITDWIVQNASSTAVTVLLKNGASDTNPIRLICPVFGSGDSKEYALGNGIRLSAATGLILNLSTATSVSWYFRYYIENASTGVPV